MKRRTYTHLSDTNEKVPNEPEKILISPRGQLFTHLINSSEVIYLVHVINTK